MKRYKKKKEAKLFRDHTASLDKHSLVKGFPLTREVLPRELSRYSYRAPMKSLSKVTHEYI